MVDSRLIVGLCLVLAICFTATANGRAVQSDSFDDADNAEFGDFMERRSAEASESDESGDDDMREVERRDFPSGHFKGPCYKDSNCNSVCRDADKAKGGHCSRWGGKCWCDQ